jgi:hypothetical protein
MRAPRRTCRHEHRADDQRAARQLAAPRRSPKTAKASTTVTSGSTVARIDAVVGPTRARPRKSS